MSRSTPLLALRTVCFVPALCIFSVCILSGCQTMRGNRLAAALDPVEVQRLVLPSNFRRWSVDMSTLPVAELDGDQLTVHNIRNFRYISDEDFIVNYYDKTFDLNDVRSVDFLVVPFNELPSLAHTMLSFGFSDGQQLAVSVEVRLEDGEKYSPVKGALRQYELAYVVADERDVIPLRTWHRRCDVFLYRTKATPQQSRDLLVDVMHRVNKLAAEPEFYDSLTNNCTTNIVNHINRLNPGRIPMDIGILLPGYSDQLAYHLGILDTDFSFPETRRRAKITDLANRYRDDPEFSKHIRAR